MKFEIRRVQNGAVLRVETNGEDSGEEIVYQEQEDDEIEAFADFLRHLVDHYGPTTSRYSPKGSPSGLILGTNTIRQRKRLRHRRNLVCQIVCNSQHRANQAAPGLPSFPSTCRHALISPNDAAAPDTGSIRRCE